MTPIDTQDNSNSPEPGLSRRTLVAAGAVFALAPAPAASQTGNPQMEITIRERSDIVTLVNIFTVVPDDQERLVQLLMEGTETLFSKRPGYIAASFHTSADGTRVVNYGQWRSAQDIAAFRTDPEIGAYFQRVKTLAQVEAIACVPAYVHHA
jgi:quinol monooxygenase YgiN